jgi:hypothetical protein
MPVMVPGFPGVTAGSGDGGARTGAERMRALRARRAAERRAAAADLAKQAKREAHEQLPLMPVAGASEEERPRPGRPAGSVARATAEWRQLILSRYRSPLIAFAETYSRPVDELAKDLGCTKREAFEIQMKAAAELAPFVHSKMPIAVQGEGMPQVGITLAVSAETAAAMGMAGPPVPLPRTVVNQALSEDEGA